MKTHPQESKRIRKHLKRIWHFIGHHNAFVIALELAISAGTVLALAAPKITNNEQYRSITRKQWRSEVMPSGSYGAGNEQPNNSDKLTIKNQQSGDGNNPTEQREPVELISKRTRTSETHDLGGGKFAWDGIVGTSLHYEEVEGSGEWKEIDPRIVPSSEPGWDWEMKKSHWRFLAKNGGWFAAGKKGVGIGFRLERIAYLNIETKEYQTIRTANYGTPIVEPVEHGNDLLANPIGKLTWANLFPGVDFEIHISGDRLHEEIKVSQAARDAMPHPPYPVADTYLVLVYKVDWGQVPGLADDDGDIDYDTDFERQARLYLKNHQGQIITALPASKAWPEGEPVDEDGEPIQVSLRKRFVKKSGQHYLLVGASVLDLNALARDTIIFDPDIDQRVADGADDSGYEAMYQGYSNLDQNFYVGLTGGPVRSAARFTGITIPTGATISSAYLTITAQDTNSETPVDSIIKGEDQASPSQYGATEDFTTRTYLSTTVAWDNIGAWTAESTYNSADFSSIITALLEKYSYSDGVMAFLWDNTGLAKYRWRVGDSYDGSTAKAPQLHIEYTAGGAKRRIVITE